MLAAVITVAAVALAVSFVIAEAQAYVLQGSHVLDLMVGRLGKMRRLQVSQRVTLYDQRLPQGRVELAEIARYRLPDTFRADTTGDGVHRIYLRSDRSAMTVMDGRLAPEPETVFDRYKDLLLYRDRKMLEKQLARLGVDITVSSLGRFEDRIVFVLGAHYPDDSKSQVWIDKENFRPLRWLVRNPDDPRPGTEFEIRYRQWAKSGPVQYPMRVVFFQDGRLVREITVSHLDVNPGFRDDLFDLNALKADALPAKVAGNAQTGTLPVADAKPPVEPIGGRSQTVPFNPSTAD